MSTAGIDGPANAGQNRVLTLAALSPGSIETLFRRYGLSVAWVAEAEPIPGSHWGEPEAGLVRDTLFLRLDTPVHSALHEGCHWVCMSPQRRARLHTDAGGDDDEENAVNYLSILLADELPEFGRDRMFTDMDAWGYTFRLGAARAWFEQDAEDARQWLGRHGLPPPDDRIDAGPTDSSSRR